MSVSNEHTAARLDDLLAGVLGCEPCESLRTLDDSNQWERLVDHACRVQCGGFLAERLETLNHDIPISASRQLRAYCEQVAASNEYKASRVASAFDALNSRRIPFLLLKGLALNATLYPSPSIRPMTDVDIVIAPHDVDRADLALTETCGCRRGEALVQDDFYPKFHYEREYLTPHSPEVKIDLHARPFRPLRFARTMPDNAMWDGGERLARLGGVPITLPSRENMLIHLCVHAACHGLSSLRWLYDIKRWLEQHDDTLNWNAIVARCEQWRLSRAMRLALERTISTFAMRSTRLADAVSVLQCSENLADRVALSQAPHGQTRPVADVLINAICSPGLGFRASYLRAALIPSRNHLGQIYTRRHWGWPAAAHAYRVLRCVTRPFQHADEAAA